MDYCACGSAATNRCVCGTFLCFHHAQMPFGSRTGHPDGPIARHVLSSYDHRAMCPACRNDLYARLAESVGSRFADVPAARVAAELIRNQLWVSSPGGAGEALGVRIARRLAPGAPWDLEEPLAAAAALLASVATPDMLTVFGPKSRLTRSRKALVTSPGWLVIAQYIQPEGDHDDPFVIGHRGAVYRPHDLRAGLEASILVEIPGFDANRFVAALEAAPTRLPFQTANQNSAAIAVLTRAGL